MQRGLGIFPTTDLGLHLPDQVLIAGQTDLQIQQNLLQTGEGPSREIMGHGERSEVHRRTGGGCQGRTTTSVRSVSAAKRTAGRLYSPDDRSQTEGAAAERLNNAAGSHVLSPGCVRQRSRAGRLNAGIRAPGRPVCSATIR